MPRRGQGQKVQTATGQQYGQVKAQEEAQAMTPLPSMQQPSRALVKPGQGMFTRATERPNESVMTRSSGVPGISPTRDPLQEFKVQQFLAVTSELVDQETASPWLRNAYRKALSQVRNPNQFADKGLMPNSEDQ